jgi:predicted permease
MKALFELWLAIREDAEFACRSLARVPTYTTAIVLTLALAIGGCTAVFSVLYAVVLRPLPFPDARELVALHRYYERLGRNRGPSSPGEYLDIRQQNQSFSKMAALSWGHVNVSGLQRRGQGEGIYVTGATVSVEFFRLLGLAPALGRDFAPGEDQPGAAPVAILSASFHRRALGGAPDVIGRSIDIDGAPHTIIGVLPRVYEELPFGYATGTIRTHHDVWRPLVFDEQALDPGHRTTRYLQVFGRLRPDVTLEAASADLDRIASSFYRAFPSSYQRETGFALYLEPLHDYTARLMGRVLWLLLGAVTLVLLAACANVASLSLARLASRRREIAVRVALGATAGRIALQFLVEGVIVALAAGVLGVIIGRAGLDGLLAVSPAPLSNVELSFHAPIFAFVLGVSGLTGVIAGAAPAWHAARFSPTTGLREGGRTTNAGAVRLRSGLVVAQVTVAFVLLVCAAMVLRSTVQLTTTSPGFEPKDVYLGQVSLDKSRYPDDADRRRFVDGLLNRLRATPGIESVGITNAIPLGSWSTRKVQIE